MPGRCAVLPARWWRLACRRLESGTARPALAARRLRIRSRARWGRAPFPRSGSAFPRAMGPFLRFATKVPPLPGPGPRRPTKVPSRPGLDPRRANQSPAASGTGPAPSDQSPAASGTGPAPRNQSPAVAGTGPAPRNQGTPASGTGPGTRNRRPAADGTGPPTEKSPHFPPAATIPPPMSAGRFGEGLLPSPERKSSTGSRTIVMVRAADWGVPDEKMLRNHRRKSSPRSLPPLHSENVREIPPKQPRRQRESASLQVTRDAAGGNRWSCNGKLDDSPHP